MNVKTITEHTSPQPPSPSKGNIAILGIPFDAYSSFMKGPAQSPQRIREAFRSPSANMCTENSLDLNGDPRISDLGDLFISDYLKDIEEPVHKLLDQDISILSLGGDHSITYPVLRAYGKKYPDLNLLQIDAHPDLYNEYAGNPYAHGCPFARIMEDGLVKRLVQVGIRTMNPHQLEQAQRFNVETVYMKDWHPEMRFSFDGPVYLSLDIDALDPAFAPGVSHHEPGGFTTRDVLGIIQNLDAPLVGADIVELNPERDIMSMTAMVAAKFYKEILEKMLKQKC